MSSLRVLIVDDDVDTLEIMGTLVRIWGHEVCLASDFSLAIEASKKFRPQAALLDIGLTGQSGWEIGRHLRQEYGKALLLIAITGHSSGVDPSFLQKTVFNAHLSTPADLDEVERLLADWLGAGGMSPATLGELTRLGTR